MIIGILDTNIFEQFRMFDEVDWMGFLDDEFTVAICSSVLAELDKHKTDQSSDRRRKRARSVLPKIEQYAMKGCEIRKGARLLLLLEEPQYDEIRAMGLSPEVTDDRILAVALKLRDEHNGSKERIAIVTDDTGVRLKARAKGLEVITPPDSWRLADEPAEQEKENKRLRAALEEVRKREPRLQFGFRVDENIVDTITLPVPRAARGTPEDIKNMVAAQRSALEYVPATTRGQTSLGLSTIDILTQFSLQSQFASPTESDIKNYYDKVETYLVEHEDYLQSMEAFVDESIRSRYLLFHLKNVGTVPAREVRLDFTVPDGYEITTDELNVPFEPVRPEMPKPRPFYEAYDQLFSNFIVGSEFNEQMLNFPDREPPNSSGWDLYGTYRALHLVRIVRHHDEFQYEPLRLLVDSSVKLPKVIELQCVLTAENIADKLTRKLRITLPGPQE